MDRHELVKREYVVPFFLVTSLFFLWGFAHAFLDVLNKHFQDSMNMSKMNSAMVQVMFYLGYFIMAIPAGLYIHRHGYRSGVVFGLILYGIGSLLFIPGEFIGSFNFFLFSLFVIACGLVFLETAANPYMTKLGERQTAASRLNLAQSFNGLGCICAPLIGGMALFSGEDSIGVSVPYMVMGFIVLSVAFLFSRVKLPEIDDGIAERSQELKVIGLWKNRLFVFGLFALFCYEISEISINSFFINYVNEGWLTAKEASFMLSICGLGLFMAGRFGGSWIMRSVPAERMLFICAIGTVCTTALVMLQVGIVSLVALCLGYLLEAIMFPTIFALSVQNLGSYYTKRAASFLMMTPIGGAVGPLWMGYVADMTSMSFAFIVPLMGFIVVLLYAWKRVSLKREA